MGESRRRPPPDPIRHPALAKALLRRVGKRVAAASVAKYVPVVGSAIAAAVGFGAMKVAGDAHVEDCYRTARALIGDSVRGAPLIEGNAR